MGGSSGPSQKRSSRVGMLDDLKGEVRKMNREFDSMKRKANESVSSLWAGVQTAHSNGVERLLSTPAGKCLDSGAKTIGQTIHNLRSTSAKAASSSVSAVVEDFRTLRRNVERNVQVLRSGSGGRGEGMENLHQPASPSRPTASPMVSFPSSKRDMLAGVVSSGGGSQSAPQSLREPPSSSVPSTSSISSSSNKEEVSEEDPHPDLSSVSATSVFSIGYVGPPLLGPQEPDSFAYYEIVSQEAPSIATETAQKANGPPPVEGLEDVRKTIGKALIAYKKITGLGFRKSSWENKMPWRNPRPESLASGLQWPQQKFSSVKERHEYHRRARRRGSYLIGPTPGWSWFAADVVFLYFLINNPAQKFFI